MSKRQLPPSQRPERQSDGPKTFEERLFFIVGTLVRWGQKDGKPPAAIRLDIHKQLEHAFAREYEMDKMEIDGVMEDVVTTPALFLMVFDNEYDQIEYRTPEAQEVLRTMVDSMISSLLGGR